ncbi:ATP-binding cassette domain-containing protein [Pectobacterium brasiliense]|uniref:ATP-binding cassette domain-containing protein n=1 Tax=Pectobacterium brasiliense TaxID=180957 RepID=UPI001968E7A9|nr:ATP-binding cassette domain-containing protein [Pectobacterium brasiliense]MBN3264538.1 ATP-binding cassette domain-containing protein [Pectobacterium brasiliense]
MSLLQDLFRKVFYQEVSPIINISGDRLLQIDDVAPLPVDDEKGDGEQVDLITTRGLILSLIRKNKKPILLGMFFSLFRVLLTLSIPVIIKLILIVIISGPQSSLSSGVIYSFLFAVATIIIGIITNFCFYWDFVAFQAHQRLLNILIYRQILALNVAARSKYNSGDMINTVGNDVQAVARLGYLVNDSFYALSLFIGVIAVLLSYLGWATFAALAVLIIFQPVAWKITQHFVKYDNTRTHLREARLSLISQLLSGIRTVKLYNLFGLLNNKIGQLRQQERQQQIHWGYKSALSIVVFGSTTTLVCLAAFGTRVLLGQSIDPTVLFPSLGLLMLLEVPFAQLPEILSTFSGVKAAGTRVRRFLQQEKTADTKPLAASDVVPGVVLQQVSFSNAVQEKPLLNKIELIIRPGEAVAIVGPVGAGKSVLLRTLLEEDERVSGVIQWQGIDPQSAPRMSYVPQEAFIFHATLKENVLMGQQGEQAEALLQQAIKVTALDADIRQLPGGMTMEVGERGTGLSGGQKQRISLARSVVARPGIVLLDDPFSALDARTEEYIVEHLLFSQWQSITRVVVTHRLNFLHRFDNIVFMKEGEIVAQGTLEELLKRDDFSTFCANDSHHSVVSAGDESSSVAEELTLTNVGSSEPLRITEDEGRRFGGVGRQIYGDFLRAMVGGRNHPQRRAIFACLLIAVILAVLLPLSQNLWFVVLSDPQIFTSGSWLRQIADNPLLSVAIYAGLGIFALSVIYLQRALWFRQTAVASGILHQEGLEGLSRAPIRFFDATMSGVLMNRFSRDIFVIENDLSWMFENMVRFTFQCLVNIVLIILVSPWIILGIIPILWLYSRLLSKFNNASREIKRLVQITQSPLFSHLSETFDGLLTIRTLNQKRYFIRQFDARHDAFQRASRAHELTDRWFSVRVPILSGVISLISAISIFGAARYGWISAGLAGVVLTYLISFWTLLNWSARTFVMVEGNLTSVERLVQLTHLQNEETLFGKQHSNQPKNDCQRFPLVNGNGAPWKHKVHGAAIEFVSTSVRYAEHLPDVLRNISLRIKPGERVGIIGRTGSGKSTILQALVGMAEISSGDILLDGISIRTFPLSVLRELIAVVPQEPFLMNDTIRVNLDSEGLYSDQRLIDAIAQVGMPDFITSLPDGLDTVFSDSDNSFSQGQRQLLCFARALLKKPKVIIMDEATSNVDVQTEAKINRQLKTVLDGITVLIIAHRASTIRDCEQIILLSEGQFVNTTMDDGNYYE